MGIQAWRRAATPILAAMVLAAMVLAGCGPAGEDDDLPADLAGLPVAAEAGGDGYDRAAFGPRWADVDRNGCSTRDDVLARDLTQVRTRGRCVVIAGVLIDPYTGRRVHFTKAEAARVQIDHVVSLAEAWRSGAAGWTATRRLAYANDPGVLLATAGDVNAGKGDEDPGTWSPLTRDGACRYAALVVAIKTRYDLTVDGRERSALADVLAGCP